MPVSRKDRGRAVSIRLVISGIRRTQVQLRAFGAQGQIAIDQLRAAGATIRGDIREFTEAEIDSLMGAAQKAVKDQTQATKDYARAIVNAGLTGSKLFGIGQRRAALTIKSQYYQDKPAGFIYSSWGYFEGSRFVDILGAHVTGRRIRPRIKDYLFIPFAGRGRRRRRQQVRFAGRQVRLIPLRTRRGFLVVTKTRGGMRGLALGLLLRQVMLPKRLNFGDMENAAATGLANKFIAAIRRRSGTRGRLTRVVSRAS